MFNVSRLARTLVHAVALAALMALAACGGDPTITPPPLATATVAPGSPTATPVPPVSTPAAAPSPTAAPRASSTATTAPRTEPTSTPVPLPPESQGPALPASIVDTYGNEVVVDDISRIVVLNGDFTEVVYALGLGENVVAVDTSATYPAEAMELPQIGYQRRISAEGILSMDPDRGHRERGCWPTGSH